MNRAYHRWYSNRLGRVMELLVFGHSGRPVLFFPPRMGRFYDYENRGIVAVLADRITGGELQLFCVDSLDAESFYNHGVPPEVRIRRHLRYEQYIIQEVLPLMRTGKFSHSLEVAGCSLCAYYAANMALRYSGLFKKLVCLSGRFDLTRPVQYFHDLFDGYANDDIYFNMPGQYMVRMPDGGLLDQIRQLDIIIAIGENDPFNPDNYRFSELLGWKGLNHRFYNWQGCAHHWRAWRQMVQYYL